jgi:hypothetical protein
MSATSRQGTGRAARLARAAKISSGKLCTPDRATALREAIIEPGDRVTIEGDEVVEDRRLLCGRRKKMANRIFLGHLHASNPLAN